MVQFLGVFGFCLPVVVGCGRGCVVVVVVWLVFVVLFWWCWLGFLEADSVAPIGHQQSDLLDLIFTAGTAILEASVCVPSA